MLWKPCRGKLIYRHEDHALYVETLVFGNPVGQWYKDHVRPIIGTIFGTAGRLAWHVVNWWHNGEVMQPLHVLASLAGDAGKLWAEHVARSRSGNSRSSCRRRARGRDLNKAD